MKQLKLAASALVLGLALGVSQAYAQPTLQTDENMVKKMMAMMDTDKDGMISKAEAMKAFGAKFDSMAKGGKMSVKDFVKMLDDMNKGLFVFNP